MKKKSWIVTLWFFLCVFTLFGIISGDKLADEGMSDTSKTEDSEEDSDSDLAPECSFVCENAEEFQSKLKKVEKFHDDYSPFLAAYKKYTESSEWTKVIDAFGEIKPDQVLGLLQILEGKSKDKNPEEAKKDKDKEKDNGENGAENGEKKQNENSGQKKKKGKKDDDGGGWTVIQKRDSGPFDDFERDWAEYAKGFGSAEGNFWLGLEKIYALTKNGDQELRIELEDFFGKTAFAKYSNFSISDAADFFRLKVGGFDVKSTAGNALFGLKKPQDIENGMQFSTKDQDNDERFAGSCADGGGGWWFNYCGVANLNGPYYKQGTTGIKWARGIVWGPWKGEFTPLAKVEMKIRKRK